MRGICSDTCAYLPHTCLHRRSATGSIRRTRGNASETRTIRGRRRKGSKAKKRVPRTRARNSRAGITLGSTGSSGRWVDHQGGGWIIREVGGWKQAGPITGILSIPYFLNFAFLLGPSLAYSCLLSPPLDGRGRQKLRVYPVGSRAQEG